MSVDASYREVARFRELAKANPSTYEPKLGAALSTLCRELKSADGPVTTSYIELLEEGIALHRRRESAAKNYADRAFTECLRRARTTADLPGLSTVASHIIEMHTNLGMTRSAKVLTKLVNMRLDQQPHGLRKLTARLRGR